MPEIALTGEAPLRPTLVQWMEALAIPGVSVAVIDNYHVAWAEGFGVAAADTRAPMTSETILQAASISKPVTALAALDLVEQGELSLDADINTALTTWRVPANGVSLRQLLAHTSGITPGGFAGYEPRAALPNVRQILDGTPPANSPPAQALQAPGQAMQYSGLGYTIVQTAMADRTRTPFPELMQRNVFEPLGMRSSSFDVRLPQDLSQRASSGHDAGGNVIAGRARLHPELAAAGMWTTPTDLAQVAIEAASARQGLPSRILTPETAQTMLTAEMDGSALGWMVGGGGMFWHNGGNEGFRAQVRMFSDTGDGIVIMTNSDNGADIFAVLTNAVAQASAWQAFPPRALPPSAIVRVIAQQRGVVRALGEYRTLRETQPTLRYSPGDLNGWGYSLLEQGRNEDAVRVFSDNVIYYPENPYAYVSLAEGQLAAGAREAAAQSYRRALELDASVEDARAGLAAIEAARR